MPYKIFISYSRKDEFFARALAFDLEASGAEIWIDMDDIPVGARWSAAIQSGLRESQLLLLVLSPSAMASSNVEDEWNYFLDKDKPLVVVYWRSCDAHFQLWRAPRVDFRPHQADYHMAFRELLKTLERHQVYLTMPLVLPSVSNNFVRKALGRATEAALQDEAEDSLSQTDRVESQVARRAKNARRRPVWLVLVALIIAVCLIGSALWIRLQRPEEPVVALDPTATLTNAPTKNPEPIATLSDKDLSSETPTAPSPSLPPIPTAITPTPTAITPSSTPDTTQATLELVYTNSVVYLRNISEMQQEVSRLTFRQGEIEFRALTWLDEGGDPNALYGLRPQHCLQLSAVSFQAATVKPPACRRLDGYTWRGDPDEHFWLKGESFGVYWDERLVTTCQIAQRFCEFSLDSWR